MEDLKDANNKLGGYLQQYKEIDIEYKNKKESLDKQFFEFIKEEQLKKQRELEYLNYIRDIWERDDKEEIFKINGMINPNHPTFNCEQKEDGKKKVKGTINAISNERKRK